jgi:hypothetical protein
MHTAAGDLLVIIWATTAPSEITSTSYGNIRIACFNFWAAKKRSLMAGEDIRYSTLERLCGYFTFWIFSADVMIAVSVAIFFRCKRLIIDIGSFFFKFFIGENKKACILLLP